MKQDNPKSIDSELDSFPIPTSHPSIWSPKTPSSHTDWTDSLLCKQHKRRRKLKAPKTYQNINAYQHALPAHLSIPAERHWKRESYCPQHRPVTEYNSNPEQHGKILIITHPFLVSNKSLHACAGELSGKETSVQEQVLFHTADEWTRVSSDLFHLKCSDQIGCYIELYLISVFHDLYHENADHMYLFNC